MVVRALFVLRRTHTHINPSHAAAAPNAQMTTTPTGAVEIFIFSFPTDAREEFSRLRHASRESRIRRQDQTM